MFWICSVVKPLWEYINNIVGTIIDKDPPSCPVLYLIEYNPKISLEFQQKCIILAASTAATKTVIKNWF